MKQSRFLRAKELFPGSDIVRRYSFKTIGRWDHYALLARANHRLAMGFAITGDQSVLFEGKDCFECLSPHSKAA